MHAIQTADRALRRFQRCGAIAAAVPTPDRILRDAGHARVERTLTIVDVETAGGVIPTPVWGAHIRVTSEAFERMGARGMLAPGDSDKNRDLLSAARRFYRSWYEAGLSPIRGQDPGKIRSTALHNGLLVGPERMSNAWAEYRAALAVLDRGERIAVEAIVLHDKLAVWVGSKITGKSDKGGSKAVAMYAFTGGLEKLAIHYGIIAPAEHNPADDVIADLLVEIDHREAASA